MPSTSERVIDGSVATVMTKAIAPLLHPPDSITPFREPQSAVQSVQSTLDHDTPCACLSLDLSKPFERINPYWIYRSFPRARLPCGSSCIPDIFFSSEDVGTNNSSVLLFCVAMDPVLTDLNRIPGMLTVEGYVDDTTMVGDTTAGVQWLTDAWNICTRLRSAGIRIDEHHCWKASGVNMHGACSGHLDQHPPYSGRENYRDMLPCDESLFIEQVTTPPLLSAEPISLFVLPRLVWMSY